MTDKVSIQKTLYYATSNNLCFCTIWQNGNGETRKLHFFHSHAVLVHCLNSISCLVSSIYFETQCRWISMGENRWRASAATGCRCNGDHFCIDRVAVKALCLSGNNLNSINSLIF